MRRFIYLSFAVFVAACGQQDAGTETTTAADATADTRTETERLNEWFEERYEEQLQQSPIQLTFIGRKERYDEVDDLSEETEKQQLDWLRATVEEMEREFDYDALTPEAQVSYDIWKYQYENTAANYEFRGNNYIFTQMFGPQSWIPTLLSNFHRVETPEDMDAYIKRVGGFGRAMNQLIDRAQAYAQNGVRPPRFAYEGVIEQAEAVIKGAPFDDGEPSSLQADAYRKIDALVESEAISAEDADKFKAAADAALMDGLQPAYDRLIAWFQDDMANAAEDAQGVDALPNGRAYYDRRLASFTTTALTADEIYRIGMAEVARLRGEMEAVKREVGFEGELADFFDFVREDDQFFFSNDDAGRQAYMDAVEERLAFINERLPDYFGLLPKAELTVKRVEPYREQDGAAQHYFPGTPDGTRPGIYYMHLSDMKAMPIPQLEVIAYHEGNPGHHMQISIAQELEDTPTFRTQANFGAYAEGWGLYAELLAKEMGGYDDLYSEFGRLSSEMWRALRLVVDTGLHSKGWTRQQAIDFMMENSAEPLPSVESEVERYIVLAGQATSYKVGMIKILELRARAEETLGDKFDISAFHDTVLGGGAVPLEVLERRVDNWIASVQAG